MGDKEGYYNYWGKADKEGNYHLLVYHCLDVAAVGECLLSKLDLLLKQIAKASGLTVESFKAWFLFFLAIHDIGKFSSSFQNLNSNLLMQLQNRQSKKHYDFKNGRHDKMGYWAYQYIYDNNKNRLFDNVEDNPFLINYINILTQITFGHHGIPPKIDDSIRFFFIDNDIQSAGEFIDDCYKLFINDIYIKELLHLKNLPKENRNNILNQFKLISWNLAGLTVICDWIGSGNHFSFCSDKKSLREYYRYTLAKAEKAIQDANILPAQPSKENGLKKLFPMFAQNPSPLQKLCNEIKIKNNPQLWILEDVTGSGKTEAALILVSRLISAGMADGCFIALPSMATSNAMYERMGNVYYRMFADSEKPSLVLAHGSRHLSTKFRESYSDTLISSIGTETRVDEKSDEGSFYCAQWLADSSKKSLLADTAVVTLDQILLSTLPVRYQSLRYFGTYRKVLIIDEVHSYDAYMLRLLENVLSGIATLGGSVVLLSATLPFNVKKKLITAYDEELEYKSKSQINSVAYPLATIVEGGKIEEHPLKTRKEVCRNVELKFFDCVDDIYKTINRSSEQGHCVCWIRNTIRDVIAAYKELKENQHINSSNILIFHSRFALHDRLNIESEVLRIFGKKSGQKERRGMILIASQVAEQSLDLDFDLLISDLAPIDLLIQRAGRLHRHVRDEQGNIISNQRIDLRPAPIFFVHIPPETTTPSREWYSSYFEAAHHVYLDDALLWRTKELLKSYKAFRIPEEARLLIESVYGDDAIEVPEVFFESENDNWGRIMSQDNMAIFNKLTLECGYSSFASTKWGEEENTPTRLGDRQETLYLCLVDNHTIKPCYNNEEFPWDMSSLKVYEGMIVKVKYANWVEVEIQALKEKIYFLKKRILICFDADNKFVGKAFDKKNNEIDICYDDKIGFIVGKKNPHVCGERFH